MTEKDTTYTHITLKKKSLDYLTYIKKKYGSSNSFQIEKMIDDKRTADKEYQKETIDE